MSTAMLTGQPVAGSPLEEELRRLGFTVRRPDGEPPLAVLADLPAGERVAVVDPRFVGHTHSLRLALADPRFPAAAVPGALGVQPAGRPALERALAAGCPLLPDRLAGRLAADGTAVHRPPLGPLVARVPEGGPERAAATAAVAAVDGEAVRLRSAVKARDGFFTTFFVSPYSRHLARWCSRRGLTPNQVTTASLVVALAAAGCAATGTRPGYAAAALLLLGSFVLDCADGQLARYDLAYSPLGGWLDAVFDRAKEYAFYAGLALGAARGGDGDQVWALALAAMILQTCRHLLDSAFAAAATGGGPAAALSGRLDRAGWTVWARRIVVLPIGERWALLAVLTALTTPRVTLTVLLIAGGAAAGYTTAGRLLRSWPGRGSGGPAAPAAAARRLAALTDGGVLAAAAARWPRPAARYAAPLWAAAGTALLTAALLLPATAGTWWTALAAAGYALCAGRAVAAPLTGPLDWLLPPMFRAAEYGTVLILASGAGNGPQTDIAMNGTLPAGFGLVAACAYHHYDTVYRPRNDAAPPPARLGWASGGHEGRILVVVLAALCASATAFTVTLALLAGALAALWLTGSIRYWSSGRPGGARLAHDESGEPA
ncbi:DUF5941 domain-containing protein [Streptomyces aidingensis]|uniref:DUF5941 domain-containing protein n=1 Tax=Streptomyces aidingensis TaxID=910347 RepID=UPI000B81EA9D|nr:DUF5941 domain-containing protein [Streptomyces aidingensis]